MRTLRDNFNGSSERLNFISGESTDDLVDRRIARIQSEILARNSTKFCGSQNTHSRLFGYNDNYNSNEQHYAGEQIYICKYKIIQIAKIFRYFR